MTLIFKYSRNLVYCLLSLLLLFNGLIAYDNCQNNTILPNLSGYIHSYFARNSVENTVSKSDYNSVSDKANEYTKNDIFYHDAEINSPIKFIVEEFSEQNLILRLAIPQGWSIYAQDNKNGAGPLKLELDLAKNRNFRIKSILWPKSHVKYADYSENNHFKSKTPAAKAQKGPIGKILTDRDTIIVKLQREDPNQFSIAAFKLTYVACGDYCFRSKLSLSRTLNSADFTNERSIATIVQSMDKNINESDAEELLQLAMAENAANAKEKLNNYKKRLTNYIFIIFASFLGGLLLNIMPCVLPVLSIKILSLVQYNGYSRKEIKLCFAVISFGIILSFWVLSAITVYIKNLGQIFGWGMHFSNPTVLMLLNLAMLFYVGNLGGLFAKQLVSSGLMQKIHKIGASNLYLSEFFFGVFITVMATPCTAPFISVATTFALTHDSLAIWGIYTLIGLGLAFPYLLAIFSDKFINLSKILSKKIEKLSFIKGAFWILAFASLVWLLNILRLTVNKHIFILFNGILIIIWLLISMHQWMLQKSDIAQFKTSKILNQTLYLSSIIGFILLFFIVFTPYQYYSGFIPKNWALCPIQQLHSLSGNNVLLSTNDKNSGLLVPAQIFSYDKLHRQIKAGGIVLVTVGAEWCMTCKINENLVIHSEEVQNMLKLRNVLWLKLRYGSDQSETWNFMQAHGRSGIPLTVVYGPAQRNGIVLPEILKNSDIIDALKVITMDSSRPPKGKSKQSKE